LSIDPDGSAASGRVRRAPPPLLAATVEGVERRTPRLTRITVVGADLAGLTDPEPAASLRVLFPSRGVTELVLPRWEGNEFLLPDGRRPARPRPRPAPV